MARVKTSEAIFVCSDPNSVTIDGNEDWVMGRNGVK